MVLRQALAAVRHEAPCGGPPLAGPAVVAVYKPRVFVQRFGQGQRETVSECSSWKAARAELIEYRTSDPSARYYLSSRCCANWRDS